MQINTLDELLDNSHYGDCVYLVLDNSFISGKLLRLNVSNSEDHRKHVCLNVGRNYFDLIEPKLTIGFTDLKEFLAYIEYHLGV